MTLDACAACTTPFKAGAAFCAACGVARATIAPAPEGPESPESPGAPAPAGGVSITLALYFTLLGANLIGFVCGQHGAASPFAIGAGLTIAFTVITIPFALARWRDVLPLYRTFGFGPRGYALVTLAAPVIVALVVGYVHVLERAFSMHAEDDLASFRSHGLGAAVLLIVIAPPLVEELGFRGVIFTSLSRTLGTTECLIISAFAFALLHLALASLVTHVLLGIYFGWLRHRSQSLWPAMYAHALHNLGVLLIS